MRYMWSALAKGRSFYLANVVHGIIPGTHHMPITKQKKAEIVDKLEKSVSDAAAIAFVHFSRLTARDAVEMRKKLRAAGVSYYVAKKTLLKRVLDTKHYTGTAPDLEGEIGIAWAKDPLASAKSVFEFAKTHKEQITLVGGVYEGRYMSKDEIMALATIPSREELLGKFVGMLNASIGNVVRVINERAKQLAAAGETATAEVAPAA